MYSDWRQNDLTEKESKDEAKPYFIPLQQSVDGPCADRMHGQQPG